MSDAHRLKELARATAEEFVASSREILNETRAGVEEFLKEQAEKVPPVLKEIASAKAARDDARVKVKLERLLSVARETEIHMRAAAADIAADRRYALRDRLTGLLRGAASIAGLPLLP